VATNAELLAEARTARHNLVTGKLARVFMDQNGERVEFTETNMAKLDSYIAGLESEIAGTRRYSRKPIGFIF
jgi:hypothetical protein